MPASSEGGKARALLGSCAITLCVCHAALFLGGIMDDAYISFRYARNLVDGLGLVFNAGERVEGYTNFSWLLLSALSLRLGVSPTISMPLVGACAAVALVSTVFAAGQRLSARELQPDERSPAAFAGLAAALLVAATTGVALYAVSGLEETFYTLLTTCAALALVERRASRFALFTSLAFLTRPEAGLLGLVAGWFAARDLLRADAEARRRVLRDCAAAGLVFAILVLPYLAFKLWYFGSLIPNTLRAKEPSFQEGLRHAAESLWPSALLAALAGRELRADRLSAPRRELLQIWAALVLGTVAAGGDWMPAARLHLPSVPCLLLVVDGALSRELRRLGPRAGRRAPWAWLSLLGVVLYVGASARETRKYARLAADWEHRNTLSRELAREYRARGVRSIGTVNIGALGYGAYDVKFLDLAGLVDAEIARGPGGHLGKKPPDAYMIARNPDLYVMASSKPIRPDASGRAAYVASLPIEEYVFSRPWFLQRYFYEGSIRLFEHHYYHVFARRPELAPGPFSR